MKAADINTNLIDSYFTLLESLSPDNKLELIARLSNSMKTSRKTKRTSLKSLYGSWISEESGDELVNKLKQARTFSRQREEL